VDAGYFLPAAAFENSRYFRYAGRLSSLCWMTWIAWATSCLSDGCSSGRSKNFPAALAVASQQSASAAVRPAAMTRSRSLGIGRGDYAG
jgi:hypothetical protein